LAETLKSAASRLAQALGLEPREARLEAQILAARALDVNRAWLIAHDRDPLAEDQSVAVETLVARRERGEPVAYILGEKEFYGRMFKVTPDVLIPRPETELLVEAALARLPKDRPARILDLGTGSGCIAITLALERPDCEIMASDVSPASLEIARSNSTRLNAGNVRFIASDWYDRLGTMSFDMIVSNPPYIAVDDMHLRQGDLPQEPIHALISGLLGLDAIHVIISRASDHLSPNGWLLFEHGYDQAEVCVNILGQAGFAHIFTLQDLGGHARVTGGQWLMRT
jgi:release factor glutamine methyltransferase